ncbi:hypothetical protein LY78DRAFT_155604 [Colletotrichum sublineola]|nr:hypothetical protein LY78DRAFT_155604 [Colletotrichum sublineola]
MGKKKEKGKVVYVSPMAGQEVDKALNDQHRPPVSPPKAVYLIKWLGCYFPNVTPAIIKPFFTNLQTRWKRGCCLIVAAPTALASLLLVNWFIILGRCLGG